MRKKYTDEEYKAIRTERARLKAQGRTPEEKAAFLEARKVWHEKNKDRVAGYKQKNRSKPETKEKEAKYTKGRRANDPEKVRASVRNWRAKNKEQIAKYSLERYHRLKHEPERRVLKALRGRLSSAIQSMRFKKSGSIIKMFGCPVSEVVAHLEGMFPPGMNWENMGSMWHVDHIIPLSAFDLNDPAEQAKANHYLNLQPLWKADNYAKSDLLPCGNRARNLKRGEGLPADLQAAKERLPAVIGAARKTPAQKAQAQKARMDRFLAKKKRLNPNFIELPDGSFVRKTLLQRKLEKLSQSGVTSSILE